MSIHIKNQLRAESIPENKKDPIKKMMAAMIVRSVQDMRSPNYHVLKGSWRWIFLKPKYPEYPFNFRNVCQELHIKPKAVRRLARDAYLASPHRKSRNPNPQ